MGHRQLNMASARICTGFGKNRIADKSLVISTSLFKNVYCMLFGANSRECSPGHADDMYVMSVRQLRVAVELVGKAQVEERQRHLENLKVATLTYAGVCSAGPLGQVRAACPSTLLITLSYFEPNHSHYFSFSIFWHLCFEGQLESLRIVVEYSWRILSGPLLFLVGVFLLFNLYYFDGIII